MARYSGNFLRMYAPDAPQTGPGGPDTAHDQPSGPEGVPDERMQQISVSPDLGTEYAGLTLEDGMPYALVVGQPSVGWNAPEAAINTPGGGATPAGTAPAWLRGDPHNAGVDTSFAGGARGSLPGSTAAARDRDMHSMGDDSLPYRHANPVGTEGSAFLERPVGFPEQMWAEPTGAGADKFIAGTNSYASSNPDGDQYTGRSGARVHYGFDSPYFVHTPLFQDKNPQVYERRTAPITATDPLVGGSYARTPSMGQLAGNPWVSELGATPPQSGTDYGVPVDGVM